MWRTPRKVLPSSIVLLHLHRKGRGLCTIVYAHVPPYRTHRTHSDTYHKTRNGHTRRGYICGTHIPLSLLFFSLAFHSFIAFSLFHPPRLRLLMIPSYGWNISSVLLSQVDLLSYEYHLPIHHSPELILFDLHAKKLPIKLN